MEKSIYQVGYSHTTGGGSRGRRHHSSSGALALDGLLCLGLHLGRHGGVVVVVRGSVVDGGVGVVCFSLFAINLLVVVDFVF